MWYEQISQLLGIIHYFFIQIKELSYNWLNVNEEGLVGGNNLRLKYDIFIKMGLQALIMFITFWSNSTNIAWYIVAHKKQE